MVKDKKQYQPGEVVSFRIPSDVHPEVLQTFNKIKISGSFNKFLAAQVFGNIAYRIGLNTYLNEEQSNYNFLYEGVSASKTYVNVCNKRSSISGHQQINLL